VYNRKTMLMKKCTAEFRNIILLRCYDKLEQVGFTRYGKESVDFPFDDAFSCWVGLNTGLYPDKLTIHPFVGIHAPPIMKLYTSLERRKYSRRIATYALGIGSLPLAGEALQIHLSPNQNDLFIESEIKRLVHLIIPEGLEYARSIASFEALLPLLESRIDMLGGYPQTVSCCLYYMGRLDEAKSFTEKMLAKEPEFLSAFAIPFLKMLESAS
jgi:hypothetical protein